MLEGYSLNVTVPANSPVPFNNVTIEKGCTARMTSPTTIAFNERGVYMVACDSSAAAASTIQLYKDGVAQPQAQSVGTTPDFITFVQVDRNNNPNCCCSSPIIAQIYNPTDAEETFTNINICVSKLC